MPGYKNLYQAAYNGADQMIYTVGRSTPAGHPVAVMLHGRGQDCHFASPGVGPCIGAAAGFAATPAAAPVNSCLAEHVRALADAGFGVAQIDNGGPAPWGNNLDNTAIAAALTYARANYGAHATKKVLLYGFSMGDISAMNFAKANLAAVAGLYMLFPACDLDYHHTNNFVAEIDAAFAASSLTTTGGTVTLNQVGITLTFTAAVPAGWAAAGTVVLRTGFATYTVVSYTGKAGSTLTGCTIAAGSQAVVNGSTVYHQGDYAANAAGRNPALFAATVAAAGIPWRGWYSTADAVVPAATSTAFAATYGPRATAVPIPGAPAHGSAAAGLVPASDLLNFVAGLAF